DVIVAVRRDRRHVAEDFAGGHLRERGIELEMRNRRCALTSQRGNRRQQQKDERDALHDGSPNFFHWPWAPPRRTHPDAPARISMSSPRHSRRRLLSVRSVRL